MSFHFEIDPLSLRILWYELAAFLGGLGVIWMKVLLRKDYLHQNDAIFESVLIVAIAVPTLLRTWKVLKRLHHLEGFLRVCAWCRKIGRGTTWVTLEAFAHNDLHVEASHGICPECQRNSFSDATEDETPNQV